jgi:hypothetical protein
VALAVAASVAMAAPLGGSVELPILFGETITASDDLTAPSVITDPAEGYVDLMNALQQGLVNEANRIFRSTPGWQCITAGGAPGKMDVDIRPELQQFLTIPGDGAIAYDGARIDQSANAPDAAGWRVGLQLNVGGKFVKGGQPIVLHAGGRTVYDPGIFAPGPLIDIREALLSALTDDLQEVVSSSRVRPCAPKARIKGTISGQAAGARVDNQVEAEGRLALDENGAFQASIPFSIRGTWSLSTPALSCSGQGVSEGTFDLTGSYDGAEALIVSRMGFNQTGGTNITNCPGLETVQAVAEDMPEAAGLRIALADGGAGSTRGTLSGGSVRALNYELSYDDEEGTAAPPGSVEAAT